MKNKKVSCEDLSEDKVLRQKESMTINIQGQEDRRQLAAILADNGYIVTINKTTEISTYKSTYYLHVEEK